MRLSDSNQETWVKVESYDDFSEDLRAFFIFVESGRDAGVWLVSWDREKQELRKVGPEKDPRIHGLVTHQRSLPMFLWNPPAIEERLREPRTFQVLGEDLND